MLTLLTAVCLVTIMGTRAEAPPNANIKVIDVYKCDTDPGIIPWTPTIENADGDGFRKFNLEIDLRNFDFTEDLLYLLVVDKNTDGAWDENYFETDNGTLCEMIRKYALKGWESMLDKLQPRPLNTCTAQRDVYKLKGFEVLKPEVQIPPLFGELKCSFHVYTSKKEEVLCVTIQVEVTKE